MAEEDELPAMKNNPKYIFFTDFDGTITLEDSMSHPAVFSHPSLFPLLCILRQLPKLGLIKRHGR